MPVLRFLFHAGLIVLLTVLTQVGGLAWLAALWFRRRLVVFALIYASLSFGALALAPVFGRVALPCTGDQPLQMHNWGYCALNRQYVTPALAQVLHDTAAQMEAAYPGTITQVLDANFPFLTGFPLLPHLSHHDGRKADLAFYYTKDGRYAPGVTRSPIGYFAFEQGPSDCPNRWPTLRWDFQALQTLWPDRPLEPVRTRAVIEVLTRQPEVAKIFVEPHLKDRLGLASDKIRFQGCRAARHDDHIHLQL